MDRFKQEKIIMKISIGEKVLGSFVGTLKEFKIINELDDAGQTTEMREKN